MMQSYREHNIQELPLSSPYFHQRVERFLRENGLRMEVLDVYCVIENESGNILAGAGIRKDIIKCIAVAEEARSEGLVAPLVSHLISLAASRGIAELKLFTKPENKAIFESLGFHELASAPKAILMENGRGLERYCAYLRAQRKEGRCGVVIMNANPFTLGHRYLLEKAASQVDTLFVIPVKEEGQRFSYAERVSMIKRAEENYFLCSSPKNQFSSAVANPSSPKNQFSSADEIVILEGSEYQISAATFPTYFLKNLSDAAETHIRLDLDLFQRHIAPALKAEVRFVGTEPDDALTNHYNTIMKECLPHVVEIPRLKSSAAPLSEENYFSCSSPKNQFSSDIAKPSHAGFLSASAVRAALDRGSFREASALCPETSWPYLLAALADRALRMELDLPGKPGLVCPDSCGAHKDMDYGTMLRGIEALRPYWSRMALASSADELRQLGIQAESAMLSATGGVNTHRGAIFCMGIALNAASRFCQLPYNEEDMQSSLGKIAGRILRNQLEDKTIAKTPFHGARMMAADGYKQLFEDWLPFYRQEQDALKTLLRIMSTLDDTCVVKRVGVERAKEVKQEAASILSAVEKWFFGLPHKKYFSSDNPLHGLCERYAAEGISPGGAADMLALTIFIHSIIS